MAIALENDGIPYQSEVLTFNNSTLGEAKILRTTFLEKARKMFAPEITTLWFYFYGTVGGVTGGALGKDLAKIVKKAIAADDEEWLNLSGASIRVLEQVEYGARQKDPSDISSGSTSSSYKAIVKLSFRPVRKAMRPRDFHLPLVSLLDAGEMQIQQCDAWPTGWATSSSLSLKVIANVVEGRKRETKARRKLTEVSYNLDDTTWPIGGSLRGLYLSSVLTTTGHTALTGITAVNSQTLEFPPDLPPKILEDRYRINSENLGSNDEIEAVNVIPLVSPDRGQKIGAMPDLRNVHLKVGSTPTSAVLIRDVVVDRPPEITAKSMGYENVAQYQMDLVERGRIVEADGVGKPVTAFHPTLVRRFPSRITAKDSEG